MLIAGSVDLQDTLRRLAAMRPIFHSEADFQVHFAWEIKQADSSLRVRLETRPMLGVHLDVEVTNPRTAQMTAIELKYLTRLWEGDHNEEHFELKNQGAGDIAGYHVVKDIHRVETFIEGKDGANGAVVVISNSPYFWKPPKPGDDTNAAMFRLGEGVVLEGERRWGPNTGAGTLKGNEKPLRLLGRYPLHWEPYSTVNGDSKASEFRQLVIGVQRSSGGFVDIPTVPAS